MPDFVSFLKLRPVSGILAISCSLMACGPSEPTTPAPPTTSLPVVLLPSAAPRPQPSVVSPSVATPLKSRTLRLQIRLDPALKQSFSLKQVNNVQACAQQLDVVETTLTFPGTLSSAAQASLQSLNATLNEANGQTLVTFRQNLTELNSNTLTLEYVIADLPIGQATGSTNFSSSTNGILGEVAYQLSIAESTSTTVAMSLSAQAETSSVPDCPRLSAAVTGAALTSTTGDIITLVPSPSPTANPTPTPTPEPSILPSASATPTPIPSGSPSAPPPVLTSISATSGAPLSEITLTGTGFTNARQVKFGTQQAFSFTVVSDTQILATVPVGFTVAAVSVVGPGGTSASSDVFTLNAYSGPPRILYVNAAAGSGGDGSSWQSAMSRLDMALYLAQAGDELWVAKGKYTPTVANGDRSKAFALKNGVALYGGFLGGESLRTERNPSTNQSIMTGDLNGNDNYQDTDTADLADNAYHVISGASGAILDGFTIQGGAANGLPPHDRGAGIFNNPNASPILNQLQIIENRAQFQGGGIYNAEGASPQLNNVSITSNLTLMAGGGIYNARGASPVLNQVTIAYNGSKQGGGMYNLAASPTLNDVVFQANRAPQLGGGLCNRQASNPMLNNVNFLNNEGGLGGALYNGEGSSPQFNRGSITGNTAQNGAGIYNYDQSAPLVKDVSIRGNTAVYVGGGVYNYKAEGTAPRFENVALIQNSAKEGGGMANRSGMNPQLINTIFFNNSASVKGGGLHNYNGAAPVLRHVTLFNNSSPIAPEIYATLGSNLQVISSVVWNATVNAAIKMEERATLFASNSCIRGLDSLAHGGFGNLNVNPYFVDETIPSGPDSVWMTADDGLRLAVGSAALNFGSNSNAPATDVLGVTRESPPDLGAYEGAFAKILQPLVQEDVLIGTGDLADTGDTVTVHYIGKLADGTVFDDSYARGTPFSFTLGANQVIQGWDQGIPGMRVGGKRQLTIPSHLAYGGERRGVIMPHSTLYFEVELVSIP